MKITKENLIAFAAQYDAVYDAAEKLFKEIEELENKYKIGYRERYDFDGFLVGDDYITLKGNYSYQGDWGIVWHDLSLEEFVDPATYLKKREQEHLAKFQEREAQKAERAKLEAKKRFEQYMALKAEFEDQQART